MLTVRVALSNRQFCRALAGWQRGPQRQARVPPALLRSMRRQRGRRGNGAGKGLRRLHSLHGSALACRCPHGIRLPPCPQCLVCPTGWHARCRPPHARLVSKKYVVCAIHGMAQQAGRSQEQQQEGLRVHGQPPPSLPPDDAAGPAAAASQCTGQHASSGAEVLDSEEGELFSGRVAKRRRSLERQAPSDMRLAGQQMIAGTAAAAEPKETWLIPGESLAEASTSTRLAYAPEPAAAGGSAAQEQRLSRAASCVSHAAAPQHALSAAGSWNPDLRLSRVHPASPPPGQRQDLDAASGEEQQLSRSGSRGGSCLALQPSWQASAARRAALDYGEL